MYPVMKKQVVPCSIGGKLTENPENLRGGGRPVNYLILTIKTRLMCIYIYKRASLACAARLADTSCPPEAPFGRLRSHWLIIREIASINMSVLLL